MLAHVQQSTGMTWDAVQDQLDLPALEALTRYWKRNPPLHVMVAAYLGIEGGSETAPTAARKPPSAAELEALMAQTPQVKR